MALFTGKKLAVVLHIVAWTILFLLPIYLFSIDQSKDTWFMGRVYLRTGIYVIIFYVNYFWLVPKFLLKGRKLTYYLSIFCIIAGFYLLNEALSRNVFTDRSERTKQEYERLSKEFKLPRNPWKFDFYNYMFTSILISGFSVGLRMAGKFNENEKKRKELEKEKLSSELAFLKNQVSPHFFFNTLNNIYSLTEINTKEAQNAILQLSKLMRYLLYESEKGDTMLSSEIAFMQNYIELMKLRLSEKVSLSFTFPCNYKDISIPPLIFVPFIENAFKHGVSYRENSFIGVNLSVTGKQITFSCKNSNNNHSKEAMAESGIGLENVQKRLNLLFPASHQLEIKQNENVFEVLLTIEV